MCGGHRNYFFKKRERLEFSSKQTEEKDVNSRALVGFFVEKGDASSIVTREGKDESQCRKGCIFES